MDFPRYSAFIEWDEDGREYYEERAAILEFEAGLPRHWAEVQAMSMLQERLSQAVPGQRSFSADGE